jgi:transcription termination factor Rho
VSWFRSSQRKPQEQRPSEAQSPAPEAAPDEEEAEAAGLEPLMTPPAAEPEPQRPSSTAPLDFFSLDPLDDDWGDDDEADEEEEAEEEAVPARGPSSRRGRGRDRSRDRSRDPSRDRSRDRSRGRPAGLDERPLADLHELAREAGIERYRLLRRAELVERLQEAGAGESAAPEEDTPAPARRDGSRERGGRRRGGRGRGGRERRPTTESRGRREREEPQESSASEREEELPPAALERVEGLLEVMADGFGFLRVEAPLRSERDPHMSRDQVERFELRAGDRVTAMARPARRSERNPSVVEVAEVNGRTASEGHERSEDFSRLAALPPAERLPLSSSSASMRMLEVVTPLGKGQRALVEGPGGAGATRLLYDIAAGLSDGPVHVVVAVVDARPEELWAWESSGSELFATTAEHAPADQVRAATLALERSKRLVEEGTEVVLLVDSLTRLARAHGLAGTRGGDTDSAQVQEAKRLFAAARRTDGGSLTIVAVARSDASAAVDAELREALAQIANVELRLDGALADAGLYPAIDVGSSRTRGEDALIDADERARLDALRGPARALEGEEAWRYLTEQLEG